MQIIIKGKQMEVTPQLRQRIERKVQRLSRYIEEGSRIEVTVTEEQTRSAHDRYCVQLALTGPHPIHSEVSALNATTALDLVLDKVVTQIGRYKDRQTTTRRHHTPAIKALSLSRAGELTTLEEPALDDDDTSLLEGQNEEIWARVLEIRRLPARPMNDKEVIAQMVQSGVAFYPFFNEETRSVNVMYKLEQGGYGLLVPALD